MERSIARPLLLALTLIGFAVAGWGETARGSDSRVHGRYSLADIVAKVRSSGLEPLTVPLLLLNGSTYMMDAVTKDGTRILVLVDAAGGVLLVHTFPAGISRQPKATSSQTIAGPDDLLTAAARLLKVNWLEDKHSPHRATREVDQSRYSTRTAKALLVRSRSLSSSPTVQAAKKIRQRQVSAHPSESAPVSAVPAASSPALVRDSAVSKEASITVVILASDSRTARTEYQEITIEPREAAPTNRIHSLSATCIGILSKDKKGFVLLTNTPEAADRFANGDTLNVTGPLCPGFAKGAAESRMTVSIKKTGQIQTKMAMPRFQYVIVGDVLSQPTASSQPDRSKEAFQDCEFCPEMQSLPAGTFSMGSVADPTEKPIHQVTVPPFALARSPVTVSQWRQCVVALACSYEPIRGGGYSDTPVHNVSWDDAQQYVAWISQVTKKSYRLPTEAEWEYAARAGSDGDYWWGDRIVDGMANCRQCGEPFKVDMPMKAASFAPNPFGLYHVAGGVAQWVADCWHENYDGAPLDGSSWDRPSCNEYILRGGSWRDDEGHLRAASRVHYRGSLRDLTHGFRIARSL
jgi:formylglycine-generating enzyme required for sulfatase activity